MSEQQHPAAGDCERLRPGLFAQPTNTLSSLAYAVAGAGLCIRAAGRADAAPGSTAFGLLVAANGLGGVAFHGPGGRFGHWLHDTALLCTLAAMAGSNFAAMVGSDSRATGPAVAAATGIVGTTLAVAPASTNALSAGTAAAVAATQVVALLRRPPAPATRRRLVRAAALVVVGSVVNLLGRTGGPICRPDSRVQGHAVWHVLTAAALYDWGRAASGW